MCRWIKLVNRFSVLNKTNDAEAGAPVAILEAQATGLPVISSYHADIPEVVVDGKSALLAPERDVGALAKHLRVSGRANPDVWGAMGRERVEGAYDVMAGWEVGEDI